MCIDFIYLENADDKVNRGNPVAGKRMHYVVGKLLNDIKSMYVIV